MKQDMTLHMDVDREAFRSVDEYPCGCGCGMMFPVELCDYETRQWVRLPRQCKTIRVVITTTKTANAFRVRIPKSDEYTLADGYHIPNYGLELWARRFCEANGVKQAWGWVELP